MPLKTVDAKQLKNWLDSGEAVLVDVREPAEHEAEYIPGSTLMPLSTVSKAALPNHTGKKLIVHCLKGARGGKACEKLLAEDPSLEIYNLEGGITAWMQAGNMVKQSGKYMLPLDRQVQLTIGTCVLAGVILGFLIHPGFFWLSGFFGLGLINAGLTGWCGLAIAMAKMPWNKGTAGKQKFCK